MFVDRSWKRGGRFYGSWWEQLPHKTGPDRINRLPWPSFVTINDRDTAEVDYSNLHPAICYAMAGKPIPAGDLYELDGYGPRKFLKVFLLTLLNADTEKKARASIRDQVRRGVVPRLEGVESLTDEVLDGVVTQFKHKHAPIKQFIATGVGVELQFLDSQLAERTMMYFAEQGEACLPVHDSFIVDATLAGELQGIMRGVFREQFGQDSGVDPEVIP